jgi:hypothetical protein
MGQACVRAGVRRGFPRPPCAPKLTRAPALYGSLGTAATLLAWLFLIARLMVSSAFVNATLWRRCVAAGESPAAGDVSGPGTAKNGDI